jgi:hypothetical protein
MPVEVITALPAADPEVEELVPEVDEVMAELMRGHLRGVDD